MWCTAEKRFMHIYATCLFKESVFLWKSNLPLYQKLEVPESCSTLHQLIMVASCLQKIELWYPSFGLQVLIVISVVLYSDCCKSTKNCRDWAFSNSGLEAGLPASLSAADVGKMRHCVCCRNPFPPSPFLLEFQASTLPEAWGPSELQHAPPVLNYFIKPIPLLQLQEKPVLCKELNNCQDWAFSNSGLEAGLPASLSAFVGKMLCTAEKRFMHIYATCLFKESMFLWKSNLALYQKLEVPESCSTLHQFWIISSSPSLCCSCRKNQSYAKNWTIAKIELLATVGWKQGCQPAFQLPMLAKCDALPNRDFVDIFLHQFWIFALQLQEKPVSCREAAGVVT